MGSEGGITGSNQIVSFAGSGTREVLAFPGQRRMILAVESRIATERGFTSEVVG